MKGFWNGMTAVGKMLTILALPIVILVGGYAGYRILGYSVTVEPGHELVLVDRPYFFGESGVRKDVVTDGRKFLWNTTTTFAVSVTPVSYPVSVDDFASKDGFLLDFESTLQLRVNNTALLIDKFGEHWFKNNVQNQYLSIVRSAVKSKSMKELLSDPTAAEDVDRQITEAMNALVKEYGLPIAVLNVTLGRARPSSEVLNQMNATAAAAERTNTFIAEKSSQEERAKAEAARASADNAYRNALGLSPDQFVELERIKQFSTACGQAANCIVTTSSQPLTISAK